MIVDTLVLIVMLISPVNMTKREPLKMDFVKLEEASTRAMRSALDKTKVERKKLLNFDKIHRIVEELKKNSVKL